MKIELARLFLATGPGYGWPRRHRLAKRVPSLGRDALWPCCDRVSCRLGRRPAARRRGPAWAAARARGVGAAARAEAPSARATRPATGSRRSAEPPGQHRLQSPAGPPRSASGVSDECGDVLACELLAMGLPCVPVYRRPRRSSQKPQCLRWTNRGWAGRGARARPCPEPHLRRGATLSRPYPASQRRAAPGADSDRIRARTEVLGRDRRVGVRAGGLREPLPLPVARLDAGQDRNLLAYSPLSRTRERGS